MIDTSPWIGLGMKPKLEYVTHNVYPIGSHSTIIGYFVKCGLLGGSIFLLGYLTCFVKYFKNLINAFFHKAKLNHERFVINSYFLIILMATFMEDLDVIETIPFFFGSALWFFTRNDKTEINGL